MTTSKKGSLQGRDWGRAMDRVDLKGGVGLDEVSHGVDEVREGGLVHGGGGCGGGRGDEAEVREGGDKEERGLLRLGELDVTEEELVEEVGGGNVVEGEGGGEDGELRLEAGEVEVGFIVELHGIEEDEEGVRASFRGGGEEPIHEESIREESIREESIREESIHEEWIHQSFSLPPEP